MNGKLICQKCGKEFQTEKGKRGQWLIRKYCPDCSTSNQQIKINICKNCGKEFTVCRQSNGRRFIKREVCDDCLKPKETKTLICQKCGKPFKVGRANWGGFSCRKYCDDCDTTNKSFRLAKCVTCGKEFKQKRLSWGGFSESKYCSYECSLIQRKTKICAICGKEFELERSEITGSFKDNGKYCSDECAKIGWTNLTKKTCQEKYGVDYPCFSPLSSKKNPTKHSKINQKFKNYFKEHNIDLIEEFILDHYAYDFKYNNILIELNPTFTHTCYNTGIYPALDKYYHYNKTKYALQNGYICLCVWDWTNWDDIIELLDKDIMLKEKDIQLYYSKNKRFILSDNDNDQNLIKQNYYPVYDDGFYVIEKSLPSKL